MAREVWAHKTLTAATWGKETELRGHGKDEYETYSDGSNGKEATRRSLSMSFCFAPRVCWCILLPSFNTHVKNQSNGGNKLKKWERGGYREAALYSAVNPAPSCQAIGVMLTQTYAHTWTQRTHTNTRLTPSTSLHTERNKFFPYKRNHTWMCILPFLVNLIQLSTTNNSSISNFQNKPLWWNLKPFLSYNAAQMHKPASDTISLSRWKLGNGKRVWKGHI